MKFFFYVFCMVTVLLAARPADAAANGCFTPFEAEAEQGIRIHSELMVIGLNCRHLYRIHGRNLYDYYRAFTSRQSEVLEMYESSMLAYYRRIGVRNPDAALRSLRTKFANNVSVSVASMRPDIFCTKYSPRVYSASQMSVGDFRRWSTTYYTSHPVSQKMCNMR